MNNEIKENLTEMLFNRDERLLDYINNLQTIEQQYCAILSENADLQQENDKLKEIIKKIKDELFKNQFEFTYYGCWLNIKGILESEMN